MTVELHQPFKWLDAPEDLTIWNPPMLEKRRKEQERQEKWRKNAEKTGTFPLRDEQGAPKSRVLLKQEAKRLLRDGNWENDRELDPKFNRGE